MNKMNFTHTNNNVNNTNNINIYDQPNLVNQNNSIISFKRIILLNQSRQIQNNIQQNNNKEVKSDTEKQTKKMKWGEPTWFLFHTLACKVKDENFQQIRIELLNIISSISSNLPCPSCAEHATNYLKSANFLFVIKTKQQLIDFLYKFHNEINAKKGVPLFPYEELETKYSYAVTKNIIFNFILHFQDKHKSVHMIANDMYRARQVVFLKEWFNNNFKYFDH